MLIYCFARRQHRNMHIITKIYNTRDYKTVKRNNTLVVNAISHNLQKARISSVVQGAAK